MKVQQIFLASAFALSLLMPGNAQAGDIDKSHVGLKAVVNVWGDVRVVPQPVWDLVKKVGENKKDNVVNLAVDLNHTSAESWGDDVYVMFLPYEAKQCDKPPYFLTSESVSFSLNGQIITATLKKPSVKKLTYDSKSDRFSLQKISSKDFLEKAKTVVKEKKIDGFIATGEKKKIISDVQPIGRVMVAELQTKELVGCQNVQWKKFELRGDELVLEGTLLSQSMSMEEYLRTLPAYLKNISAVTVFVNMQEIPEELGFYKFK